MDMKTATAVRRLLKAHRPIAQEGIGYTKDNDRLSLPILCECGEGWQDYWNDQFNYTAWLDHFQVALLDMEVPA